MEKRRLISWNLIIIIIATSILQGLLPVTVLALSAGGLQTTIASIIISLMLECGVAPVNQAWLNTLNTSYGIESSIGTLEDCISSGLLTQSGNTLIDTGLSAAIEAETAYTELGLADVFTTYSDDIAYGVSAASGGANLASVAINCGTLGTIGAFAGAASVGVGLGVLIDKVNNYIKDFVKFGLPMSPNTIAQIANNVPSGYDTCAYCVDYDSGNGRQYAYYWFGEGNVIFGKVNNYQNNLWAIDAENLDNVRNKIYYKQFTNKNLSSEGVQFTMFPNGNYIAWIQNPLRETIMINCQEYSSLQDFKDYANQIRGNPSAYPQVVSPDIIGKEGNQKVGDVQNVIPDGYEMKPIDMNDYENYVDSANNNTEDGNTGQAVQGEQFEDLIDSLLVEPSIIPDQGVTDPEVPDRPIIPDQPTVPGKDPITGEEQSEVLQGITTPDLRSVFPFCIPFDLYNIFGVLKYEGREAPVIVWNFEILGNSYPVIIDLTPYEEVASLLRLLELLAFIVGLAVATRKLIGAGG